MKRSGHAAGVVLASGVSKRFGSTNKLLAQVGGEQVVLRTTRAYVEAGLAPVVVVVGYQAAAVRHALSEAGLRIVLVDNPEYAEGQSRALVRGVRSLPEHVEAAVIGVGDQPWLLAETIGRLVDAWQRGGAPIVAPAYNGQRGNPVLFARSLFGELAAVNGDVGGRPVIQNHLDAVEWVPVPDARQATDIDVPGDLLD